MTQCVEISNESERKLVELVKQIFTVAVSNVIKNQFILLCIVPWIICKKILKSPSFAIASKLKY